MEKTSSPSESIKSPSTIKNAVDTSTGPRYGRPAERFGPPAVLFSQPLALLSYDLEHLETFTPNAVIASYASDFISNTTTFFRNDGEKEASLRSTLEKLLIGTAEWQRGLEGGTAKPGGVWHEDLFAYLIVGIKNEPGLGGDPFLQSLIVYNKILAQQLVLPPSFSSHSADIPPTVRPVLWTVKLSSCLARPGWEPSRHIGCHLHRFRLCR